MSAQSNIAALLRHACAWALAFLCLCPVGLAQDQNIRWLQSSNAMASTAVDDIVQDAQGNMLFASHLGLFSYDGRHYTHYTQEHGLANSSSSAVERDPAGRIWIIAYSGKISILEDHRIREFTAYNQSPYCGKSVARIFFQGTDRIVVDQFRKGVMLFYRLQKNTWVFEKKVEFNPEERIPVITGEDEITWIEHGQSSTRRSITIRQGARSKELPVDPKLLSMFRRQYAGIAYLALEKWLIIFHPDGMRVRHFDQPLGPAYQGVNGSLWLTYTMGGLQELNAQDLSNKGEHFLKDTQVNDLCQDIEGKVWLSTVDGKLGVLPYSPYKKWNVGESLNSPLNCVFALDDTLFIGHTNGDVGYLVPGSMPKETLLYSLSAHPELLPAAVRRFALFQGQLYFVSTRNGLFRISRNTLRVEQVLPDLAIWDMCVIHNQLYLACSSGLYTFDGRRLITLRKGDLRAVTRTPEGEILLGQLDGLYTLKAGKTRKVNWPLRTDERITAFATLKQKTAVATFGSGILIKEGNVYTQIREQDGLPSDYINFLHFNAAGQLVVASGNGIALITFQPGSKKGFDIQKIAGSECMDRDTYDLAELEDRLFFSSHHGLLEVRSFSASRRGNPLVLKSITLNGKTLNGATLTYDYGKESLLEISYRQNSFVPGEHSVYYYRLHPGDPWIRTHNESILLSGLDPGNYTLELYAVNPYTGFRSERIERTIRVVPQLYQRAWFKVFVVVSLLLVLFLLLRFWMHQREAKRKKALEIQLEISRLEARALRSQMNPHFIFNSLNSIQSFILKNERDMAYKFLGKFSAMVREILENSQHETISIADEIRVLTNYLDLEKMRADNSFTYAFHLQAALPAESIRVPIMLLQPLVENAVVHGVLPLADRPGHIAVHFRQVGEESIEIVIHDNGIGREASRVLNQRKNQYHQSMGMGISQERARKHRAVDSSAYFEIRDLHAADGSPEGTEVIIRIHYTHDKSGDH